MVCTRPLSHACATGASTPRSGDEVLVFVDSDARPEKSWLKKLVAPLADETLGASTGYRWFLPVRPAGVDERRQRRALGADD